MAILIWEEMNVLGVFRLITMGITTVILVYHLTKKIVMSRKNIYMLPIFHWRVIWGQKSINFYFPTQLTKLMCFLARYFKVAWRAQDPH